MRRLIVLVLALMLLLVGATAQESQLYVKKAVLPESFILGVDVSSVISHENSGVQYYDFDGREKDLFEFSHKTMSIIYASGYGTIPMTRKETVMAAATAISSAAVIGQRAAAYGLKLLVDFHYSDFWADPGKQQAPKAWQGMKIAAKGGKCISFYRRLSAKTQGRRCRHRHGAIRQ